MGSNRRMAMPVAAAAAFLLAASQSDAGVVSLNKVVTNGTTSAKSYDLEASFTMTEALLSAGVYGSVSVAITDFRGDSALLTSQAGGLFMSGWVNDAKVKSYLPLAFTGPDGEFRLQTTPFGQNSFSGDFGSAAIPESVGRTVAIGDVIKIKMQFVLSAGDQAAISGVFNVVESAVLPTPAAAPALLGAFTLVRRRRFDNR